MHLCVSDLSECPAIIACPFAYACPGDTEKSCAGDVMQVSIMCFKDSSYVLMQLYKQDHCYAGRGCFRCCRGFFMEREMCIRCVRVRKLNTTQLWMGNNTNTGVLSNLEC